MGPGGAAAAFAALVSALAIESVLVILALSARRGAPLSPAIRGVRWATALQAVIFALGFVFRKRTLRSLSYVVAGRWLVVAASAVGAVLAIAAIRRKEPGAVRWLIAHLFLGAVSATVIGEAMFGAFLMM